MSRSTADMIMKIQANDNRHLTIVGHIGSDPLHVEDFDWYLEWIAD